MNLKDYIFYRLYLNYKKGGEAASFSTICFFWIMDFFIGLPIVTFLLKLFNVTDKFVMILVPIYSLIILIYNLIYYNKKKIELIKKTYKNSPYNKSIKGWVFYFPGWILIFIGLLGTVPAARLAKWILLNWIQ